MGYRHRQERNHTCPTKEMTPLQATIAAEARILSDMLIGMEIIEPKEEE